MQGASNRAAAGPIGYAGKLFGAALDASDDPWTEQLKLASIWARQQGQTFPLDPYDAIVEELARRGVVMASAGKFPVPSWLWPLPAPSDAALVTAARMRNFVRSGGLRAVADQVKEFVAAHILPDIPVMAGVDHSVTGGVVAALSQFYGPDSLSVVVLDRHFDALPLELRMQALLKPAQPELGRVGPLSETAEEYCCGNFWAHLIEEHIVRPEHLIFVGVADYPAEETANSGWRAFRDAYLAYANRGCGFFPLAAFEDSGASLARFFREKIVTPNLYVSLDVDVGAERCVHAARYMDGPGLGQKALLDVAHILAKMCRSGRHRLAGFDLIEFNMHLVGLETPAGARDETISVAVDFMDEMLSHTSGT